ncbi:TIGR02186 family protein [Limibacillus halophilus]
MRARRILPLLGLMSLLLVGPATQGRAVPLIADLSNHLVAITTGFSGTEMLLFGAVEERGDVVVVIKGPPADLAVYRKSQVAGVWMNTARQTFEAVPSFLAIASSAPVDEIAPPNVQARHQLNLDALVPTLSAARASPNVAAEWKRSLVASMQGEGLYPTSTGQVTFLGDSLFRTNVTFPSNVPTGSYLAQVFYLRDGAMISAQTTPLFVSRVGVEADIYFLAHKYPISYGVVAILLALLAGWLAHVAFRRS